MNYITDAYKVWINPAIPIEVLYWDAGVSQCDCPERRADCQGDNHFIYVDLLPIGVECCDINVLMSVMRGLVREHRVRILTPYEALSFNSQYPEVQGECPFVTERYAFGGAVQSQPGVWQGAEFSALSQFAFDGTPASLSIAVAYPTDVNLSTFEDGVIERDFRRSLLGDPHW